VCVQSLNPKGNIVRTDITSVEPSPTLHDRDNVFTICTKSSDKWQVSAANEVSEVGVRWGGYEVSGARSGWCGYGVSGG
jgi:hypothetical protein